MQPHYSGCKISFVPLRLLQTKLNSGEGCLHTASPYDMATLIKQFCRELPEPLFPSELHAALLKAQTLSSPEDRTSALQLLSCLLPARNSSCLHYLFNFLSNFSHRFVWLFPTGRSIAVLSSHHLHCTKPIVAGLNPERAFAS